MSVYNIYKKEVDTNDRDLKAAYDFHQGKNYRIYEYLGAHKIGNGEGNTSKYVFRAFSPCAERVDLTGDFNLWGKTPMRRITVGGLWEAEISSDISLNGTCYKYCEYMSDSCVPVSDLCAICSEGGSRGASIIYNNDSYEWGDEGWMRQRKNLAYQGICPSFPLNIYQMHIGMWKARDGRGYGNAYLNYRDIGAELAEYISDMGYTHICLLPIFERREGKDGHAKYESAFSPSSRYGSPEELKLFVDTMHMSGVGVILEWDPSIYDGVHGENERKSLCISSAAYWLREYHIDGLYINVRREHSGRLMRGGGEISSRDGKAINEANIVGKFREEFPDVIFVSDRTLDKYAEDVSEDPLRFYADRSWTENVFDYVEADPAYKKYKYGNLNYSLTCSFGKNNILPITDVDVFGAGGTLIDKMQGGYEEKFLRLRLFYGFMMLHPGKKMMFMGCELGEASEWRGRNQLEWFLTDCNANGKLKKYVRSLNRFYLNNKALWDNDSSWKGFEWVIPLNQDRGIMAFKRKASNDSELLVVMNFGKDAEEVSLEVDDAEAAPALVFDSSVGASNDSSSSAAKLEKDGKMLRCSLLPISYSVIKIRKTP